MSATTRIPIPLCDLPENVINKVTHLNAMREYSYDPFSVLGRENCTVSALRAQATHVDTTPVSYGGAKPRAKSDGPVTSGDVVKMFTDQMQGVKEAS
jgi:hypothetical protein